MKKNPAPRWILALYLVLPSFASAAPVQSTAPHGLSQVLSIASDHSCAILKGGVRCWGLATHGQKRVPKLTNPVQVVSGLFYSCALADEGVRCWGNENLPPGYDLGQTRVPPLDQPSRLAADTFTACALTRAGVRCWGEENSGSVTKTPSTVNASQILVSFARGFLVRDGKIETWGASILGPGEKTPELKDVSHVASTGDTACAATSTGLKCWGFRSWQYTERKQTYYDGRENDNITMGEAFRDLPIGAKIDDLVAGAIHYCALAAGKVRCFGDNFQGISSPPPLKNPTSLAAATGISCALDASRVKCWGANDSKRTETDNSASDSFLVPENLARCPGDPERLCLE